MPRVWTFLRSADFYLRSKEDASVGTVYEAVNECQAAFPPFSRRGCASIRRSRSLAAQTGWLVKGRVASSYARVAILILFEIINHPVCAAKGYFAAFIDRAATLLKNRGEWSRLATKPIPLIHTFHDRAVINCAYKRFRRLQHPQSR